MVRRSGVVWGLAIALPLLGAGSSTAGVLSGNVATDMPAPAAGIDPAEWPFKVFANPLNSSSVPSVRMDHIAQPTWMTDAGRVSGLNINDLRFMYTGPKSNDTVLVGVNFFGIAGDADANGVQGSADPTDGKGHASTVVEKPHLGNEAIWVQVDYYDKNGFQHGIIAGVPGDKSLGGPGLDGFTVDMQKNITNKDGFSNFGSPVSSANMGNLLFDPSAAHPGFVFTLPNFSQLPGIDLTKGIYIMAGAGSNSDEIGEDFIPWKFIPGTQLGAQSLPEPTTLVAWSLVAVGAAWRMRRRRAIEA
jgi:hypothetical protein